MSHFTGWKKYPLEGALDFPSWFCVLKINLAVNSGKLSIGFSESSNSEKCFGFTNGFLCV